MDNAKLVKIVKENVLFVFPFLVNDLSMPKLEEVNEKFIVKKS